MSTDHTSGLEDRLEHVVAATVESIYGVHIFMRFDSADVSMLNIYSTNLTQLVYNVQHLF